MDLGFCLRLKGFRVALGFRVGSSAVLCCGYGTDLGTHPARDVFKTGKTCTSCNSCSCLEEMYSVFCTSSITSSKAPVSEEACSKLW